MWKATANIATYPNLYRISYSSGPHSLKQMKAYVVTMIITSLKYSELLSFFVWRGVYWPTMIVAKITNMISCESWKKRSSLMNTTAHPMASRRKRNKFWYQITYFPFYVLRPSDRDPYFCSKSSSPFLIFSQFLYKNREEAKGKVVTKTVPTRAKELMKISPPVFQVSAVMLIRQQTVKMVYDSITNLIKAFQ